MGFETSLEMEKKAVEELKKRMNGMMSPELLTDKHVYYRFLKARNFDLNKAEIMLKKALEWRKAFQVNTLKSDHVGSEVLTKYISQSFIGFDKQGMPVRYGALGNSDGKGLLKSSNRINVLRKMVENIEADAIILRRLSKMNGNQIPQCSLIYDMENMSLSKATHKNSLKFFMEVISVFQDNYPEQMKYLYVINASIYFTIAFSVVKTIIQGALIDKIRIFGQDGWKEELLKAIDPEVLPAFLGGTRTDPNGDPRCASFMNFAGNVPESYYLTKDIARFSQRGDVKLLIIDRQSCKDVSVEVNSAGTVLNWQYETTQYDIGFGLMYRSLCGNQQEMLLPVHKLDTEYEPETRMYRCGKAGFYILTFDNSHSWFHSKEVYYRTWMTNGLENERLSI